MQFQRVDDPEKADADSVIVTLFKCEEGIIRGWYVGPIARLKDGGMVPYVPQSRSLLAIVALVQAKIIADKLGVATYIVDPEDLWEDLVKY